MDAIGRLKELAPYEPLARRLLARVSHSPQSAGLTVQPPPITELPLYVRSPHLARVKFRNLLPGEPLRRILAHFATDPRPQSVGEVCRATGLNRLAVQNIIIRSDDFQRDGVDPHRWTPKPHFRKDSPCSCSPATATNRS